MARLRSDEDGFTLVELLVAMVLLGVVGAMTVTMIATASRTSRLQSTQVDALNRGKIALERTTRDIRGADPLLRADRGWLRFELERDGARTFRSYCVEASTVNPAWRRITTFTSSSYTDTTTCATATTRTTVLDRIVPDPGGDVFTYLDADGDPVPFVTVSGVQRADARLVASVRIAVVLDIADRERTIPLVTEVGLRNYQER